MLSVENAASHRPTVRGQLMWPFGSVASVVMYRGASFSAAPGGSFAGIT
jgi:hypothetical protein